MVMTAESLVLAGRVAAEALMVDACTITRRDGTTTTNATTGVVTPNETPVYTGACRIQNRAPRVRSPIAGEAVWLERLIELQIPMSATDIRTGDGATITASLLDPHLVGVKLRITASEHKSHATMRRVQTTEGGPDV